MLAKITQAAGSVMSSATKLHHRDNLEAEDGHGAENELMPRLVKSRHRSVQGLIVERLDSNGHVRAACTCVAKGRALFEINTYQPKATQVFRRNDPTACARTESRHSVGGIEPCSNSEEYK